MRRLVLEVVINESSGNFQFGKTDLPDDAKWTESQLKEALVAKY